MKIWNTLIALVLVFGTIDAATIFIRRLSGFGRMTLDVDLNDTIAIVKAKIVEKVEEGGKKLPQGYEPILLISRNDKTLADYEIKDEGTLWVKFCDCNCF